MNRKILNTVCALLLAMLPLAAAAERVKDLASVLGVRDNQLLGYGLVVGLDGTGDQGAPHTIKSTLNMLTQMGITLPEGTSVEMKSLAAVLVTANLPAFARPGQTIDITISSIGNARSLRGGTLVMTPLKGADGQVYAMAQGNLLIGEVAAPATQGGGGGSKTNINNMIVGRVPSGATVERAVPTSVGNGDYILLTLNSSDFTTATRLSEAINKEFPSMPQIASALDGRAIRVLAPQGPSRVVFMSRLENLQVDPAQAPAKVIINARTGSVVMNQSVTLEECSIAHGNLTVVIQDESAKAALGADTATAAATAAKEKRSEPGTLMMLPRAVSLNDVIRALNAIGATSKDLVAILQAMKASGALRAELEVI